MVKIEKMKDDMVKESYVSPRVEVIEIESEGILCASGDPSDSITAESDRWGGSWGDDF